mgnify:CR=1 FL=1
MSSPIIMLLEVRGLTLYGGMAGGYVAVHLRPFRPETEYVDPGLEMMKQFEEYAKGMPKEMQDMMTSLRKMYEMEQQKHQANVGHMEGRSPWEESAINMPTATFLKMGLQVGDIIKVGMEKEKA